MLLHYDALHQLTRVEQFSADGELQSTTAYRYDAFGRRMAKIHQHITQEAPQTHYFGWDGDRLAHTETDATIQATIYEPDSFVPMLMIHSQKPKLPAPPAELQAMEKEFPAVMQELITTGQIPSGTRELMGKLGMDAEHISAQVQEFKQAQQEALDQAPMSIHHVYCDHLGTPRALFDLHGSPVWLAEYDDWGSVTKEFNPLGLEQNLRFQGQQWDVETGLFYNRYRYYDCQLGRYINQDPIGLKGGMNSYQFPTNPVQYSDPLGLFEIYGHKQPQTGEMQYTFDFKNPENQTLLKIFGRIPGITGKSIRVVDAGAKEAKEVRSAGDHDTADPKAAAACDPLFKKSFEESGHKAGKPANGTRLSRAQAEEFWWKMKRESRPDVQIIPGGDVCLAQYDFDKIMDLADKRAIDIKGTFGNLAK